MLDRLEETRRELEKARKKAEDELARDLLRLEIEETTDFEVSFAELGPRLTSFSA